MDRTAQAIGVKLKRIRAAKGFTQGEVAGAAKITTNYYARIERGEATPKIDVYHRIAKALHTSSSDIFPF